MDQQDAYLKLLPTEPGAGPLQVGGETAKAVLSIELAKLLRKCVNDIVRKGDMVNDIVAAKCELIIESNKLAPVCFSIQRFAHCSQKCQQVDPCVL